MSLANEFKSIDYEKVELSKTGDSLFTENGGTYSMQGDYYLPNVTLPKQKEFDIGVWGERRRRYLKEHHKIIYSDLLTSCQLYPHLEDVNKRATEMEDRLVKELSEREGVTEELKASDMLEWVRRMNSIKSRVAEIINKEIIFA